MSAADDLRDRLLRHQIFLQRLSGGLRNELLAILNQSDSQTASRLLEKLERFEGMTPGELQNQNAQLTAAINEATGYSGKSPRKGSRAAAWAKIQKQLLDDLETLGGDEAKFTAESIRVSMPADLTLKDVPANVIAAAVKARPFRGRILRDWAKSLAARDRQRITDTIRIGVIEGRGIAEIVRGIMGTRKNRYQDGLQLGMTRRAVNSMVRTAVNHTSNIARSEVFEANSDIIEGLMVVATLDGRTTPVCRARDGMVALMPGVDASRFKGLRLLTPRNLRPPFHWGCRTTMVAVFDLDEIANRLGERPFVRTGKTRRRREIDFRKQAKEAAGDAWKGMSEKERRAEISRIRRAWTEANVGRVPSAVTYDDWMRQQDVDFQNETLGVRKAQLFRDGLHLEKFVDRSGRELTLKQLRGKS